jgi:glutamine---fructose-6-phosphate transaminase (isomerizing)
VATLLEREIAEQGAILRRRARAGANAAARAAGLLAADDVGHIVVAARGSSDNAARFAQYLLGQELGIQVGLAAPWLFRTAEGSPRLTGAAVIGISQSGRSPDVVAVLAAARQQQRPAVAITGDLHSPLAAHADVVVPLLAGQERSVAATKTYLASLQAVLQVVEALAPDQSRRDWLERLPDLVDAHALELLADRDRFDPLVDMPLITVTGRGLAFAAASESALKLRELSGIPAEAFSPPDLMHGPIAALDGTGGAWLIEPGIEELDVLMPRSAVTTVVSAVPKALQGATVSVQLPPRLPRWGTSVLATLSAQAAGLRLAERRGVNVDKPHGLSKVTLTH